MGCGSSKGNYIAEPNTKLANKTKNVNESERQIMSSQDDVIAKFSSYRDNTSTIDNGKHQMIAIIEHYMPAHFPLVDSISDIDIKRCRASWTIITRKNNNQETSTLVKLVDTFYIDLCKKSQKFEKIFTNVKERASILTKALTFILSVNQKNEAMKKREYYELGILHRRLGISHWMFSVYISTLIQTIAEVLNSNASIEVMESWTRLCSYTLRFMLEAIIQIKDLRKLEYAANYSTELQDELVSRSEVKKYRKMTSVLSKEISHSRESSILEELSDTKKTLSKSSKSPSRSVKFLEKVEEQA